MGFRLTAVELADAADLARYVDFPAMQDGPLYRLTFPGASAFCADQREAIVQFYIYMLEEEGIPVGFCGWTSDRPQQVSQRRPRQNNPLPETLDVESWIRASADLRVERNGPEVNCRMVFGVGSLLMQSICEEFDRSGRWALVMASPAGLRLYTKSGFEAVGVVSTPGGQIERCHMHSAVPAPDNVPMIFGLPDLAVGNTKKATDADMA
ncbi:hypothetical protein GGR51DRAFT_547899 [Nemania sp. FL0031]|nr:hypothetical protein GGR51DRAFT_547899 [Nemania sp. FL0031]